MIGLFDLPAQRCHNYPVKRRGTRYYYRCACPAEAHFTPQRHAWVQRGRQYQCRRCGNLLHFTGQQAFHS
jgi:SprT protein